MYVNPLVRLVRAVFRASRYFGCLAAVFVGSRAVSADEAGNQAPVRLFAQRQSSSATGANVGPADLAKSGWQRAMRGNVPPVVAPAGYNELHIRGVVDERAAFRIGRRQTDCQWQGTPPAELTLNGVAWTPEPGVPLFSVRQTAHLPPLVYMNDVSVEVVAGRGDVWFAQVGRGPEAHCLLRIDDSPEGSDQYEIVLRFGVSLPAASLDPQTPDRVARKFAERPRTPLPLQPAAASDAPAALPPRYVAMYDAYGSRDAGWDGSARDFLSQASASTAAQFQPRMLRQLSVISYPSDQHELSGLLRVGAQLADAACNDPLVLQLCGRNLALARDFEAAERLLEKADAGYRGSSYPKWSSALLAVDQAIVRAGLRGDSTPDEELMARAVSEIAAAAEGPFAPHEVRHFRLELMRASQWPAFRGYFGAVLAAIGGRPAVDPWLVHMLTWRYQFDIAFDDVPDQGIMISTPLPDNEEPAFQHKLALARNHLLEAWRLQPQRPEAAESLMLFPNFRCAVAGESRRFWFDQAVEAELGYLRVYSYLLNHLGPSNSGSTDQMLAFARECLAVRRYDTDVPWFAVQVFENEDLPLDERINLCRRPDVYAEFAAMLDGYVRQNPDAGRIREARLRQLAMAVHARKADVARRLAGELGDHLDDAVLAKYALTGELIRSRLSTK